MSELSETLRAWRDRADPDAAGLHQGPRRRAVGLRREELAGLAGVSADYLVRLEQGRASRPSPQVVDGLARALRLTEAEHEHLLRLAGHTPPGCRAMCRAFSPALQRIVSRLDDLPVLVFDQAWSLQTTNALGLELLGEWSGPEPHARNLAWRQFTGVPSNVVRTIAQEQAWELELVADLRAATARWPDDSELSELVAALRERSGRFAELWRSRAVAVRGSEHKVIEHRAYGRLELDCDVLTAEGSDLVLVVYSAAPNTATADALELLAITATATRPPSTSSTVPWTKVASSLAR